MTTDVRITPDPVVVRRQNELFDLYNTWPGSGDPDDDPAFVAAARKVMGLAPLDDEPDAERADSDEPFGHILRCAAEQLTAADFDELYEAMRAAGADITPGHDQLHHYWTLGEGKAKWVESPTPWRTLVAHLTKFVGLLKAKVFASRWYIEVFGYAAGSDKARVAHGKPPRGKRIGPG